MTRLETCSAPPCSAILCHRHCLAVTLHTVRTILLLYLLAVDPLSTGRTPPCFTMASPTTVRHRHHTESTLAAIRTLHEDMDMTHGTPCTPLSLQRIITKTSTWTRRRLTDATTTDRAISHDSFTHLNPSDDDLDELQRRTSAPPLPSTTSFHHLADNSLSPPSLSLHRTTIT